MRCSDVKRELNLPTGSIAPLALAAHLASCPSCAAASASVLRFDRMWSETRPELPSSVAWNTVWAGVEERLAAPAPEPIVLPMRRWIRWTPVAAAAAVVLGLLFANRPGPVADRGLARTEPVPLIDASIGQTLLYHVDSNDQTVVQTNEQGDSQESFGFYGYDDFLAFLNEAETGFKVQDLAAIDRPTLDAETMPE